MSMLTNATFGGLAPLATMSSTTASTPSSADKGEGVKTGENEGEFMATNNVTLLSILLTDFVLVRTESSFLLGKYQLSSFKERIPVKGIELRLAMSAIFESWCSLRSAKAGEMSGWRSIVEKDAFLPPTLAFILRRTFVGDRGERSTISAHTVLV